MNYILILLQIKANNNTNPALCKVCIENPTWVLTHCVALWCFEAPQGGKC